MERPLRLREKVALAAHLWMCTECTNYRKQMKSLREVAQAYATGQAVTSEAGEVHPSPGGGGG